MKKNLRRMFSILMVVSVVFAFAMFVSAEESTEMLDIATAEPQQSEGVAPDTSIETMIAAPETSVAAPETENNESTEDTTTVVTSYVEDSVVDTEGESESVVTNEEVQTEPETQVTSETSADVQGIPQTGFNQVLFWVIGGIAVLLIVIAIVILVSKKGDNK